MTEQKRFQAAHAFDVLTRLPDAALHCVVLSCHPRDWAKFVAASPFWFKWSVKWGLKLSRNARNNAVMQHTGVLLSLSTTTLAHITHAEEESVHNLLRLEAEEQGANKSHGLKRHAYASHLLQYVSSDAYLRFEPHVRVKAWFIDVCIEYVRHGRRRVGCAFIRRLFWCVGPVFSAPLLHKFKKAVKNAFNTVNLGPQENVIDLVWKTSLFVDEKGRSPINVMAKFIVDDDEVMWQQALNGILQNFVHLRPKMQVKTAVSMLRSLLRHKLFASATFVHKELLCKFCTTLSPEERLKAFDQLLRLATMYEQDHWRAAQTEEREFAVHQIIEKCLLERQVMQYTFT